MPELRSLSYLSKARRVLNVKEVQELARAAAETNAKLGITGYLYAHTGHYFQYLEGPEPALSELMTSIAKDKRHQILHQHDLGGLKTRRFEGWSMRYLPASALSKLGLEHLLFELVQDATTVGYSEGWVREKITGILDKLSQFQTMLNRPENQSGVA